MTEQGEQAAFVPEDFEAPRGLDGPGFRLEPLGPEHNDADHAAWSSSIAHIQATPGLVGWGWPPAGGMTLDENLRDLRRHAEDFAARRGFTYSVLEPDGGDVIGCVYIYPARDAMKAAGHDAVVRSWVRADRAELDVPLYQAVSAWLATDWPFGSPSYAAR